ncbi:DUF6457 domain-containing protein [Humibacter sp. RRB41]|uniref:DUF6457 domain-containing protein n=1 Tax=Humibacter sp. RRB41 TaxID=2919946 RepID=UPI001FA9C7DF|nr:DUF6457 domain-containing protein [Humibacter sp. RRB41]
MSDTTPDDLAAWVRDLAETLQVPVADVPIGRVLDLARDVAHGVARAGAPVSAFVAGLAVGRGLSADEAWRRIDLLLKDHAS